MSLTEKLAQQLDQLSTSQFLIAFSGGLDSTVLLNLLKKFQSTRPLFQLRAIHIHHGLSPNADHWATHCQQICQQLAIPLIIEKVQVTGNQGIEANARQARYQAIRQHLQSNEVLLTAHHQQDQVETFFLALKRGSGIQGLGAMSTQSTVFGVPIYRPLLAFSRQELEDYAQSQQLCWIEDESNADNKYDRNFLRNAALPLLRERWGHFDVAVQRAAQHCTEQQQLINELLQDEFQRLYQPSTQTLNITHFAHYSEQKQNALLRYWLSHLKIAMPSLRQLNQLRKDLIYARDDANPQFQLGEKILRRYQDKLYVTEKFADLRTVCLSIQVGDTIQLPDNLGALSLVPEKTQKIMTALWHSPQGTQQSQLPFTHQIIQVKFTYTGKIKIAENAMRQEMKKIWQQINIPPWQRYRIPLLFINNQLKTAVGIFNVLE